ncbi:hypothetical protein WN51_12207 [Melipona quadrifasciata]|uniref:Uncharacterized protein n=1 Tax=Melipona quadrifasciata TaxID=166423 RepID=A0A0M9A3Y4_9HYME|nr:hypothetical protein WN51_12207 [Melipona quadrifasciata]
MKVALTTQLAGVAISGFLSTSCKESITLSISLEIIQVSLIRLFCASYIIYTVDYIIQKSAVESKFYIHCKTYSTLRPVDVG